MKTTKCLGIVILSVVVLLGYFPKLFAESSTIAATISIVVLERPKGQVELVPDVKECLDSQLQKNPQSLPEIKVEEMALSLQSPESQMVRYTICEKP